MRSLALVLALTLAGCNSTPDVLAFSMGAQIAWPVDPRSATVGGATMPDVFSATVGGWDAGTGTGTAITDWPSGASDGPLTLSATWVELLTGRGWQAEVSIDPDLLQASDGPRPAVTLVTLMGRNGHLRVTQGTTETLAQTCGTRLPDLDEDLRVRASGDQRLSIPFDQAAGLPAPPTPCPDPAN